MFNEEDYNRSSTEKEAQNEYRVYTASEKFIIGCLALSGVPVPDIEKETGMSRAYIYQQKEKVEAYAASLDEPKENAPAIELSNMFIKRAILILALYCRSPLEGIQCAFEHMFQMKVSIGYISGVINEAAERAQAFDDSVSLEGIHQGANDEIFQCGIPVLTGIDAESSYIYLLDEAGDRTGETWEIYLSDRKDHGLELSASLNDGAAGLKAGVLKVYPDINIQLDVFHASYEMGKEVSKVERKAYARIKDEYNLQNRLEGKRPQQKTIDKLEEATLKTEEAIRVYDIINILYAWLKELLGFSGYGPDDTTTLIGYILNEMEKAAADFPGLQKECEKIRKNLPSLLSYIHRLETRMRQSAMESGIPLEAYHIMYRQLSYSAESRQHQDMEYQLVIMLMDKYTEARCEFQKLLNETKKASSLVENLNGRIRKYMEVKRFIPKKFLVLLKVFFNTRRYKRSRCKERIGKSPLEILTNKTHPEFLETLGYC